jgi:hypothetical protein
VEPVVEVMDSSRASDVTTTFVRLVEGAPPSDPIAPAALYSATERNIEVQQLHRLVSQREDETLHFESYDLESPVLERGSRFVLRSWWLPTAWDAVTDPQRVWNRERFDGDDEFCLLTWEEIRPGDEAFRSNLGEWISEEGYNRFIRDDVLRLRAPR